MKWLLLYCSFLCLHIAYGSSNYSDKNGCQCIGVEYLYVKPSIDDPYFGIATSPASVNVPVGTRFANRWSYHSGVRVKGLYSLPCARTDLYGEGFYLSDEAKRSITFSDLGFATKGAPADQGVIDNIFGVSSKMRYRVWSIKGGFKYCVNVACPILASVRFAIQYANLRVKENIQTTNQNASRLGIIVHSTHSWGVGPEVGFDVGYQTLLSCLSIVSRGSYALLAGRISASTSDDDTASGVLEIFGNNDSLSNLMSVVDMKLGLNYEMPFRCFCTNIEIGYNFMRYDHALDMLRWIDDVSEGLSIDQYTPFMAHGLYVSLSGSF